MDASERMKLVRILEKMKEHEQFSRRLGISDGSAFQKSDKENA